MELTIDDITTGNVPRINEKLKNGKVEPSVLSFTVAKVKVCILWRRG